MEKHRSQVALLSPIALVIQSPYMTKNKKRVVFYMEERDYLKFRSLLVFRKMHMATWLRNTIGKYVKAHEKHE